MGTKNPPTGITCRICGKNVQYASNEHSFITCADCQTSEFFEIIVAVVGGTILVASTIWAVISKF